METKMVKLSRGPMGGAKRYSVPADTYRYRVAAPIRPSMTDVQHAIE